MAGTRGNDAPASDGAWLDYPLPDLVRHFGAELSDPLDLLDFREFGTRRQEQDTLARADWALVECGTPQD